MRKWGLGLIPIASVIFALILFQNRERLANLSKDTKAPSLISPTAAPHTEGSSAPEGIVVPAEWKTYSSQKHAFSMRYSPDQKVLEHPQAGVTFTKIGETQAEGTELFDGFTVNVKQDTYTQNNFEDLVKTKHAENKNDPATHTVTDIKKITIAGISGFTFKVSALGEFTHYYLPAGNGEYVQLVMMVADPENQGYQKTVNDMLASLKLL